PPHARRELFPPLLPPIVTPRELFPSVPSSPSSVSSPSSSLTTRKRLFAEEPSSESLATAQHKTQKLFASSKAMRELFF
ncbi:MAG TPA: hypothetical protein VGO47_15225, partial [Chlamydiales bacterium]|nr:hypothetical protein [Chlamydiales bacterium]